MAQVRPARWRPDRWDGRTTAIANGEALRTSRRYIVGEALQPVPTAKTVRVGDDKRLITDCPFTEAEEYLVVEASDMNEALEST